MVTHERRRLSSLGCDTLADRVEHVSNTRGDGLGYDVLSFNRDGDEHFIEVKTQWLGGIDVHHTYFEGIEERADGLWQIQWGS